MNNSTLKQQKSDIKSSPDLNLIVSNDVPKTNISSPSRMFLFLKRAFDLFCATLAFIILLPLFLIVMVAIKIDSKGPAIYSQERVGKNGKIFKIYKFRTMVQNSKQMLEEMLEDPKYKKQWDENKKIENDPRVTKVGKFLRKTSLDELPQMLNILNNDMSLIGPRPLIPGELDIHNGNHEIYEKMKPGITSWWASHGRSDTTYDERLALEYYYVQNCSLILDIKCICATIKAVITKKGAK